MSLDLKNKRIYGQNDRFYIKYRQDLDNKKKRIDIRSNENNTIIEKHHKKIGPIFII